MSLVEKPNISGISGVSEFPDASHIPNVSGISNIPEPPRFTPTTSVAADKTSPRSVITSFPHRPLTTVFTEPVDCHGITQLSGVNFIGHDVSCLPQGFTTGEYFSPGLRCPSGYVTACHDTTGAASVTTVTCCPTLSDLGISLSCVNPRTLSGAFANQHCTWQAPPSGGTILRIATVQNGVTQTIQATIQSPGGINGYGIAMVYQSADLLPAPSASSTQTPEPQQDGLSTNAKVAIGVTIPVVALATLCGVFFYLRRKKAPVQSAPPSSTPKPILQAQPSLAEADGREIHSTRRVELPATV